MASSVAELSVPWQLAWTMTLRLKAEMVAQREQHVRPGVLGQVLGLGAEREALLRPEDMAMRIDRARRRDEARARGVRRARMTIRSGIEDHSIHQLARGAQQRRG